MALPRLSLSLQFGDIPHAARHRQALPRHTVTRCIRHALALDAEITVRIVGQAEGLALNQSYRAQDHATNVLTFDYAQSPLVLADLVLCAPVVAQEPKNRAKRWPPITPICWCMALCTPRGGITKLLWRMHWPWRHKK